MAIAARPLSQSLTYEQYRAEEEINRRYDIVEGVRTFMPGPKWQCRRISGNVAEKLRGYERTSGLGLAVYAPFDVLIRRRPLQVRQPDVLFITYTRLAERGGIPENGPLEVGPEFVVEILSPTETRALLDAKIADYQAIDVRECWVILPNSRSIEVLRLTAQNVESIAVYPIGQTLQSEILPGLAFPIADIFAS